MNNNKWYKANSEIEARLILTMLLEWATVGDADITRWKELPLFCIMDGEIVQAKRIYYGEEGTTEELLDMVTQPKMKPCPFCGGDGEIQSGVDREVYWAECKDACGVNPSSRVFDTKQEAVDVWNRRAGE